MVNVKVLTHNTHTHAYAKTTITITTTKKKVKIEIWNNMITKTNDKNLKSCIAHSVIASFLFSGFFQEYLKYPRYYGVR